MKNIDSDLIRGNIDTIILTTMLDGDKYGLDIIKEVEIRSNGTYELKQPTLYSCLKRLENQELISSYWLDSDIGGRRHYYKLTEKGKESLLQKQEEWAKSKFIIDNLLSNHNYDEYRLVKKEDYDKIIEGKQFEYNKEESPAFVQDDKIVEDSLNESDSSIEEESLEEYPEDAEEDSLENFDQIDTYNNDALIEEDSIEENFDQEESNETIDEPAFDFSKRIDYNDENDDVENDYPNQKRFKIPSIYDSINIDEDELNSYKTDSEENIQDIDEESNIEYEDTSLEDDDFISEYESYIDDENTEEDEDIQYNSLLNDEYNLGEDSIEEDDDRVYISNYNEDEEDDEDLDIPTNTRTDQAQNELNILSRLRMQDDEEINEYVGDKNSYINHLNQNEEIENLKRDDLNVVQEDLLSSDNYLSQSTIDNKINEFSEAIDRLNNFSSEGYDDNYQIDEDEDISEIEDTSIQDELIFNSNAQEESTSIIDFKQVDDDDDYLDELEQLNNNKNYGFFNSLDSAEYSHKNDFEDEDCGCPMPNTFDALEDINLNNSTDSSYEKQYDNSFEKQIESYNNQYGYYSNKLNNEYVEEFDSYEDPVIESSESNENYSLSSFDDIIAKSADNYTADNTNIVDSNEYKTFVPRFTGNTYKQKLNNLSAYSMVNTEESVIENITPSEEVMNKVKDIQTLKAEFEGEGIAVKEFKKSNAKDDVDRNYLLVNKLNLIRSLILLFGYVFLLSAVYIIMNNTSAQTIHDFSFKYFLYGFIPFVIYALIYSIIFIINPYKKVPAKYAPRIMIFISIIITIQLLLITYCVNLQLGFYSFSQNLYNHLLWIIPTFISFAPIVTTLIYMALYYSKNFNV